MPVFLVAVEKVCGPHQVSYKPETVAILLLSMFPENLSQKILAWVSCGVISHGSGQV